MQAGPAHGKPHHDGLRCGLSTRRRHGRHGVHSLGRVRDHAQQCSGQQQYDQHRCHAWRQAVLLFVIRLHLPRYVPGAPELTEEQAYPALPDNEYGWEKLYAERMAMAFGRRYNIAVRIARFQNCYGPEGTWTGGREKAPAAICRKVAEVGDGGTIEIWGDGSAVRSYTYVDDLTDGIYLLMHSDLDQPANIGCPQYVSVNELVDTVARVAGKRIRVNHTAGPVGVQSRNFSNARMYSIGWKPNVYLQPGIELTYPWIAEQV